MVEPKARHQSHHRRRTVKCPCCDSRRGVAPTTKGWACAGVRSLKLCGTEWTNDGNITRWSSGAPELALRVDIGHTLWSYPDNCPICAGTDIREWRKKGNPHNEPPDGHWCFDKNCGAEWSIIGDITHWPDMPFQTLWCEPYPSEETCGDGAILVTVGEEL